ncbi:MAG TPA: hypothetical protein VGS22_28245 [Thermoanaerobaculia bacterium]|jgi:hypothetical protein|nr:hypothetical protein [Thermoanaerobaculia bacterium]
MKRPSSLSGVTLATAALFSGLAAGVALRYVTLFPVTKFQADADCIQTGLCALRILAGDFRVFYNGVRIGAIESYLHALAFMILGPTRQAMGYAPWIASSLGMLFTWLFVRRLAGGKAAVWGLFAIALPAPAFLYWTVQPNGYSVTLALAAATLWLGAWVADEPERRVLWLAFGLVVGLSWWASLQTLSVSLPVIAWLVLRKAPFGLATGRARLAHCARVGALAAAGFLVGAAPWIVYNVRYPFASFTGTNSVARPTLGPAVVADNLRFLTADSLPELFVSTDPEGGPNPPRPLARALRFPAAAVYCLAFGWFFSRGDRDSPAEPKRSRALALLLIGATVAINVFSTAGSTRGLNVRYVLPIYLLAPLALGLFLVMVAERRRLWGPALAAALVALLIAFSASVYFWPTTVMRQRLHAAASGEWQVLALLRRQGVDLAVGEYWLVYPLNFASREWIRAVPCDTRADLYGYGAALRQVPERFALMDYSTEKVKAEAARAGVTGEITWLPPSYAVLIGESPAASTPAAFLDRLCGR